ncbi:MAG: cell division protein FtsL [Dethiobacter sp.]|nr:cell division protein FtsL [Dethiobacter sp.]
MLQVKKINYPQFEPFPYQHNAQRYCKARTLLTGKKLVLLGMVAICFMLAVLAVSLYSSIVSLHYQIKSTETQLNLLADEYRSQELEIARLSSLGRIDHLARNELGMREPVPGQIRILTASRGDSTHSGE